MAFPPRGGDGFVSVQELVNALPNLGLPHFQRGRVWDSRAVSMLMESLIDDTPCGSIILWHPRGGVDRQGRVPGEWGAPEHTPHFLVVDGQQRLTALKALWDESGDTQWAVNLAAFPEFGLKRHRVQSAEPFIAWPREPLPNAGRTTVENYRLRAQHLVRLRDIRASVGPPPLDLPVDEAAWEALVARIQAAAQRRFHVLIKRGCDLPQIVNLYNRINSSGVPVRKEERAYAAMVSIDPKTPDWLRECFRAAHPDKDDSSREAVLKRERERFFGFPLFVAAYTQTVGFHRNLNGDLDLLARENPDLAWVDDAGNRKAMRDDSYECTRRTADILRSRLLCDDLRFLPSAEPLRLAFALLLKYPRVDDQTLAHALLLGQLNRITGHTRPNRIEKAVLASNRIGDALDAFPSVTAMLGDARTFEKRLRRVESMNDPWVSLMYWYQRANHARDYLASQTGEFLPLDRAAEATKEHIVPFSLLYRHYGMDSRGHSASHVVNAIGNLTMVSSDMNYGHGSDPVELRNADPKLLGAHHLDDAQVLRQYASVISAIQSTRSSELIRTRYERFVRVRTKHLAAGMYGWLLRITEHTQPDRQMRPRPRRISPSPADLLLQEKSLPKQFKDTLLDLGVRRDGTTWLLYRASAKYKREDKIRVTRGGGNLHVGLGIPGIESLTVQLDALLTRRWADQREVIYTLHPSRHSTQQALRLVQEFVTD